ncbi:MAG: cytochrome c, partial [Candidatus Tectomicrobia bacterium]|nr:cytochrome c [Candidatus Tectomicrobia bacterium]
FAESVVNPNAVIVTGEGYIGPDGRSSMPEYNEMTLAQLIDLVAYLKSLGAPSAHTGHDSSGHTHQPAEVQPHDRSGHGSHSQTK